MKITGTRDYIRIEYDEMIVRFDGEMVVNGFYANSDTIRCEPPYNMTIITSEVKNKIIEAIKKETQQKDFKIFFE